MLTSCGLPFRGERITPGKLQVERINVPMPADTESVWDVQLNPGAATVRITSGGEALVQGVIEYNANP